MTHTQRMGRSPTFLTRPSVQMYLVSALPPAISLTGTSPQRLGGSLRAVRASYRNLCRLAGIWRAPSVTAAGNVLKLSRHLLAALAITSTITSNTTRRDSRSRLSEPRGRKRNSAAGARGLQRLRVLAGDSPARHQQSHQQTTSTSPAPYPFPFPFPRRILHHLHPRAGSTNSLPFSPDLGSATSTQGTP